MDAPKLLVFTSQAPGLQLCTVLYSVRYQTQGFMYTRQVHCHLDYIPQSLDLNYIPAYQTPRVTNKLLLVHLCLKVLSLVRVRE